MLLSCDGIPEKCKSPVDKVINFELNSPDGMDFVGPCSPEPMDQNDPCCA